MKFNSALASSTQVEFTSKFCLLELVLRVGHLFRSVLFNSCCHSWPKNAGELQPAWRTFYED
jgi:hypothetical protein